jgi:ribosomal protein L7/L12
MATLAILLALGVIGFVIAIALVSRASAARGATAAPTAPDLSGLDDDAFRERVVGEIDAGRKIEAIKLVRERTQLGLADAKALVDALAAGDDGVDLDLSRRSVEQEQEDLAAVLVDDPELAAQLVVEIAAGRKIEAIKLLRERTGLGLKEAKDAIEALERGD